MNELVYLIRHGEVHNPEGIVYADLPGYGLSELGRTQAIETARRIPPRAAVVCSPLERAVETATLIAGGDGFLIDDALTEWRLGRRWAGLPWSLIDDDYPGELASYLDHPHDLPFAEESLAALAARFVAAVLRHRSTVTGPLVIVSHQDPIQAGRLTMTGRPLSSLQTDKPAHASVITMEAVDGSWRELGYWEPPQGALFPPV